MTDAKTLSALGADIAPDAVRFERLLPGPIERVWSYLADADKRALWLGGGAFEPREGGAGELRFDNGSLSDEPVPERYAAHCGSIVSRCTVTRWDPPHRLGFLWEEEGGEPSHVLFELSEAGSGVRLNLTHSRLTPALKLGVSGGWHAHLAVLEAVLEGRSDRPFWSVLTEVEPVYKARGETAGAD